LAQPARPEANTRAPQACELEKFPAIDRIVHYSLLWMNQPARDNRSHTLQDRGSRSFIPEIFSFRRFPRCATRGYNSRLAARGGVLEAFLVSAGIVALAEIGDKTQLLALVLAARYRRPVPVILGIFVATLANHALAAWLGAGVAAALGPEALRWILGLSFLAMAA